MRFSKQALLSLSYAAALVAGSACGDDAPTSSGGSFTPPSKVVPPDAGRVPVDTADAEAGAPDPLEMVHEPDTPCSAVGGTVGVVFAGDAGAPAFDRLGKVATRWFAGSRDEQGFVLFDPDGSNATELRTLGAKSRAESSGTTLGVLGRSAGLSYGMFDALGEPVGSPVTVTADPSASRQALARGGEGALLLWSTPTNLFSATVDAQGMVASLPSPFEAPSSKSSFVGAAAYTGTSYAVAWSVLDEGKTYRTSFALATADGVFGPAIKLHTSAARHTLVSMRRVPDGFAVLINLTEPVVAPLLLVLDGTGKPVGPGRILDGASTAFDVAARTTELGVVALRNDHRVEFRPFAGSGSPLGPWVCLDAPGPENLDYSAAIDSDEQGYAVLHRMADDGQALRRFDRLGTGP